MCRLIKEDRALIDATRARLCYGFICGKSGRELVNRINYVATYGAEVE